MKFSVLQRSLAMGCAVFLLAGCMGGAAATTGVTKAGERSGGFMGLVKNDSVMVNTPDAFKGTNEVVVGSFIVGFAVKKTDSAKAGGGLTGSGFGGKSTAICELHGVDDAVMQQITDAAYQDFVKDLQAQGITVADRQALLSSDAFKGIKPEASPHVETQGLFGTNSMTKYFAPSSFGGVLPFLGDIPGVIGGFGFSNPAVAAAKYADEGGKKVVHAVYVVDFANSEKYGSWISTSSNVNVGQGLSVIPEVTKIGIIGGYSGSFSSKAGNVVLGQPINSEKPFAEVKETTGEGYKALETAVNVVGLLGGVGTNKSRDFSFDARKEDYRLATEDAISQATDALVGKIGSLK